ncbi:MAG: GNAT family N-acetyltransferase [Bacillota bacterium]
MPSETTRSIQQNIKQMEHDYISLFTSYKADKFKIIYQDNTIKDMYTHNFTLYKDFTAMLEDIPIQLNHVQANFYRVETYHKVTLSDLPLLSKHPNITVYDIYHINSSAYPSLLETKQCHVLKATTAMHYADGTDIDIEANAPSMGKDFAVRRIKRKIDIYKNPNTPIDFYVCYYKNIPVGNIEYAYNTNTVKLEDFDILPKYQRLGFGRTILKVLLKRAYENHIDDVYLLTDQDDTAKYMYQKCGFKKIGEKTELFFSLTP